MINRYKGGVLSNGLGSVSLSSFSCVSCGTVVFLDNGTITGEF